MIAEKPPCLQEQVLCGTPQLQKTQQHKSCALCRDAEVHKELRHQLCASPNGVQERAQESMVVES